MPDARYNSHTMKRVTYHFTEQQIKRLGMLSRRTGLSVAEHVRRAVDEYLRRELGRTEGCGNDSDERPQNPA